LTQRHYARTPRWIAGFVVYAVGQLLNASAAAFASQSLLATLGTSCSLVANLIYARFLLKERPVPLHVVSVVIIIAGAALVVFTASHGDQDFDLDDLESLFRHRAFVIYSTIAGVVVGALLVVWWRRRNSTLGASIAACVGATLGSFSYLLAKCTVQLIKASVSSANQFSHPMFLPIVVSFVSCAVGELHFMNVALRTGNALIIIPVYYVVNTVLSVGGGLVYFQVSRRVRRVRSSGASALWSVRAGVLGHVGHPRSAVLPRRRRHTHRHRRAVFHPAHVGGDRDH
jgi:drug/metabolite transporter (DMT)-like permease